MNQEIKAKWLSALRSGEYQQGKQALKLYKKFCCLGVLCDIHSKETKNKWVENIYLDHQGALPQDVIIWAGLKFSDPSLYYGKFKSIKSLSDLNDSGKTFLQIADLIEAQL
jgi:hypothetical protein